MVFIRYHQHSKDYVIYGEHPNDNMMKIESCDVNFLENEFLSICEIKNHLELYEWQHELQPSLDEGENLYSHKVTFDGIPPTSDKNARGLYV